MDTLKQLLRRDRIFLRREAIAAGLTDRDLSDLVAKGTLAKPRRGSYTDAQDWDAADQRGRHLIRARAVVHQANSQVVLSHVTAVAAYGGPLWGLPLDDVHLTRLDERAGRREAGIAQHRGRLAPEETDHRHGLPITSPDRTAVDLTATTDLEHALPCLDWMLHTGLVTTESLKLQMRRQQHTAHTLATVVALAFADGRAESVGESRIRYLCWRFGLPAPIPNLPIRDGRGRVVARVDLAWPSLGVFLEFDGKEKYNRWRRPGEDATDVVLRQHARQELVCSITGWRCVRVRWRHLSRPEQTAAWLASVLAGEPVYDNPLRPRFD